MNQWEQENRQIISLPSRDRNWRDWASAAEPAVAAAAAAASWQSDENLNLDDLDLATVGKSTFLVFYPRTKYMGNFAQNW